MSSFGESNTTFSFHCCLRCYHYDTHHESHGTSSNASDLCGKLWPVVVAKVWRSASVGPDPPLHGYGKCCETLSLWPEDIAVHFGTTGGLCVHKDPTASHYGAYALEAVAYLHAIGARVTIVCHTAIAECVAPDGRSPGRCLLVEKPS